MENSDADTAGPLPQNFNWGGGDEYLKKKAAAIWKLWFETGLWDYRDAIRLAACGPCNAIKICTDYCEKGIREFDTSYPDDIYGCFHSKLRDINDQMSAFFRLYESEAWSHYGFPNDDIPDRIPPTRFIEWAVSKTTISIPQEMRDWLESLPPQRTHNGSARDNEKIIPTTETCEIVAKAICDGDQSYFGDDGKLGPNEFLEQVKDTMEAQGTRGKFQKTAARNFFKSSESLKPFKR